MPVYEYTALDSSGKGVKGMIDAESSKAARARLRKQGIFPTALNPVESREHPDRAGGKRQFKTRRGRGPGEGE
ncbi:MAG: hypothetical protein NT009_16020 [Proteobacteria bacterium]|nr:hypothetical protein [Pseudomonadota bacterium]